MARKTRKCGVYAIINQVNAHRYIGSSCNIGARWARHRYTLRHNKHDSIYLQNAWNKYGEASFVFTILEYVDTPEQLRDREQYYMDIFYPEYNILPTAFSWKEGKHTKETKELISKKNKGHLVSQEQRELLRKANLGKQKTPEEIESHKKAMQRPEVREKLRQRQLGKKASPETRAKMRSTHLIIQNRPERLEMNRQAHLGRKISPEAIEKRVQKLKGQKRTPEQIERIRAGQTLETRKAAWEKRRANKLRKENENV